MIVFLFRPSPQVPEPSINAAEKCYAASVFNVAMQREQIATGSVDLTWIFTQSIFMALNTILWSLSYPEIRKEHPIDEVQGHLDVALEAIALAAERWPGVESALRLYRKLIAACLKTYNTDGSFVVHSPSNHPTPTSSQDYTSPAPLSSPSSTSTSFHSQNHWADNSTISDKVSPRTFSRGHSMDPSFPFSSQASTPSTLTAEPSRAGRARYWFPNNNINPHQHGTTAVSRPSYTPQSYHTPAIEYSGLGIDPTTPYNTFPSILPNVQGWDPSFTTLAATTSNHLAYVDALVDPMHWMGSMGHQYSQYFHGQYPIPEYHERTLSQQEQTELMESLEENVPDVSAQLVRKSATFYQS